MQANPDPATPPDWPPPGTPLPSEEPTVEMPAIDDRGPGWNGPTLARAALSLALPQDDGTSEAPETPADPEAEATNPWMSGTGEQATLEAGQSPGSVHSSPFARLLAESSKKGDPSGDAGTTNDSTAQDNAPPEPHADVTREAAPPGTLPHDNATGQSDTPRATTPLPHASNASHGDATGETIPLPHDGAAVQGDAARETVAAVPHDSNAGQEDAAREAADAGGEDAERWEIGAEDGRALPEDWFWDTGSWAEREEEPPKPAGTPRRRVRDLRYRPRNATTNGSTTGSAATTGSATGNGNATGSRNGISGGNAPGSTNAPGSEKATGSGNGEETGQAAPRPWSLLDLNRQLEEQRQAGDDWLPGHERDASPAPFGQATTSSGATTEWRDQAAPGGGEQGRGAAVPGTRWLVGAGVAVAGLVLAGIAVVAVGWGDDGDDGGQWGPPAAQQQREQPTEQPQPTAEQREPEPDEPAEQPTEEPEGQQGQVVTGARAGRTVAALEMMDGARTVTVTSADLGDDLFRIVTPESSGGARTEVDGDRVALHLLGNPDSVQVTLSTKVRWDVRMSGSSGASTIDLGRARVANVEFSGGAGRVRLTLPPPDGTLNVRMSGGVDLLDVRTATAVPVRVRVARGAGSVVLDGLTHSGVAAGETFAAAGWGEAVDRVDVEAAGGLSTLTVAAGA